MDNFIDRKEIDLLIKMDIEGPEYNVLESLAESNLKLPDLKSITLLVEWHPGYFENKVSTHSRKNLIKEKLTNKFSAKILDWH